MTGRGPHGRVLVVITVLAVFQVAVSAQTLHAQRAAVPEVDVTNPNEAVKSWLASPELFARSSWHPPGSDDQPDAHTPFQWTGRTIAAAVAAAACALLANAAGLGGGPFFIPLFNVGMDFPLQLCAGLSHTVVAVGAFGSILHGLLSPSPNDPTRTLLSFDLAMLLLPAMLFGIAIGVVLNPLSPEWVQTTLLSCLLVAITQKTVNQGVRHWRAEQAARQQAEAELAYAPLLASEVGTLGTIPEEDGCNSCKKCSAGALMKGTGSGLGAALRRIPYCKAGALAALWCAFVVLQMLKATVPHCTFAYAGLALVQATILASFTAAFAYSQAWRAQRDPQSIDPELRKMLAAPEAGRAANTDPAAASSYEPRHLLKYIAVVAGAGFIAGFLGIAGAMLYNPYLLALGVHPQIVAATSTILLLFGSSSVALSFYINGMLNISYIQVFAPIAFVASLIGVTAVSHLVKRTGRQSVLLLLMSGVLAVGTVSVVAFGGTRTVRDIQEGRRIGFNSICGEER